MEIKVLCTFLDGRNRFVKDELRQVGDEEGAYFCSNGWAEDTSGKVTTGEIKPGTTKLRIRNVNHEQTLSEVG